MEIESNLASGKRIRRNAVSGLVDANFEVEDGVVMRGLVLSGGGANGAFEVGVLRHILGELQIHYEVICGVSVGALNGAVLAQYQQGQEKEAFEHLATVWEQVNRDKDIYRKWCHGLLWHLPVLWHKSIYSTKPLQKIVEEHVALVQLRTSGKQFRVGAVCWNTGEYRLWNQVHGTIKEAILASSAFPVFFEPIKIEGAWYTDGGLRDITPIKAAIDAGCDRIDVIQCGKAYTEPVTGMPKVLKQIQVCLDIVLNEIDRNDYEKAVMVNRLVEAGASDKKLVELHRIRPASSLGDSLDFGREKRERNNALGYDLAVAYPEWGERE
jgi:NTE family protein